MTAVAWSRGLLPNYHPTMADLLALNLGWLDSERKTETTVSDIIAASVLKHAGFNIHYPRRG